MITTDPYGISHAERPWVEPRKRTREKIYTYDRPAQIERCQRCEKPECTNCIGAYGSRRTPKMQAREREFIALYESGKTDEEIAQAMWITRQTVCYRRKKHGMAPNLARPKVDPCGTCRSRGVCDAHGGTCGEKTRFLGGGQHGKD